MRLLESRTHRRSRGGHIRVSDLERTRPAWPSAYRPFSCLPMRSYFPTVDRLRSGQRRRSSIVNQKMSDRAPKARISIRIPASEHFGRSAAVGVVHQARRALPDLASQLQRLRIPDRATGSRGPVTGTVQSAMPGPNNRVAVCLHRLGSRPLGPRTAIRRRSLDSCLHPMQPPAPPAPDRASCRRSSRPRLPGAGWVGSATRSVRASQRRCRALQQRLPRRGPQSNQPVLGTRAAPRPGSENGSVETR